MITKVKKYIYIVFIRLLLILAIDKENKYILEYIYSDFYRYSGNNDKKLLENELFLNPGLKFSFFLRLCSASPKSFIGKRVHAFSYNMHKRYFYKYGYEIPIATKIDKGFQILHFGHLMISPNAVIGENCTIFPGVTLGQDTKQQAPCLGNNVWVGTNAILIGGIKIGNNVLIAPGSYVNFNIPDNSMVLGNPAKFIIKDDDRFNHLEGYIVNTIK